MARGAEKAAETGRGWVWETSRWTAFHARKGGMERVKMRGATMTTTTDGGGRMGGNKTIEKTAKIGGAED